MITVRAGALATASASTCALVSSRVVCFGVPATDGLGRRSASPDDLLDGRAPVGPAPIDGEIDVESISADPTGYCALSRDGAVWCWGQERRPECPFLRLREPTRVALPPSVAVAGGARDACAIDENGVVRCWGCSRSTSFGLPGDAFVEQAEPIAIAGIEDARAFVSQRCVATDLGEIWCWGEAARGLSDASVDEPHRIERNDLVSSATAITYPDGVPFATTMVLDHDGRVWRRSRPIDGDGPPLEPWSEVLQETRIGALGSPHPCVLDVRGRVRCWGPAVDRTASYSDPRSDPAGAVIVDHAVAFAVHASGGCALADEGPTRLRCWGASFHPSTPAGTWPPVEIVLSP